MKEGGPVNGEQRNRHAAVLLVLASAMWWAEWFPAVLVTAFFLWTILGDALLRQWRRVWPPAAFVLIPLLLAATFVFWVSTRPTEAKVLPVALNLFALSIILVGRSWRPFAQGAAFRRVRQES